MNKQTNVEPRSLYPSPSPLCVEQEEVISHFHFSKFQISMNSKTFYNSICPPLSPKRDQEEGISYFHFSNFQISKNAKKFTSPYAPVMLLGLCGHNHNII